MQRFSFSLISNIIYYIYFKYNIDASQHLFYMMCLYPAKPIINGKREVENAFSTPAY